MDYSSAPPKLIFHKIDKIQVQIFGSSFSYIICSKLKGGGGGLLCRLFGLIVILPAAGSTRKGELIEPLLHSEGKEGGVVLVMEYVGLSETIILKSINSSSYLEYILTER